MSESGESSVSQVKGVSRRNRFIGRARKTLAILIMGLVTYYALFQLPFLFPPRERLWSASYAFGFNNAIAIGAFAGLLGVSAVGLLALKGRGNNSRIQFSTEWNRAGRRSLRIALGLAALLYAGLTFLMSVYDARLAPRLMWETRQFLHQTLLMDVYGLHPYSQFSAEYGPILIYSPLFMYRCLEPLGASLEQAYFACHFLLNLAGLFCAYYLLSRARMGATARLIAFSLLAFAGFAPYMGLNGVLLRYLCPFASLVFGHCAILRTVSRPERVLVWLGIFGVTFLLLAANILLSPEAGVAFALAWVGYGVLTLRQDGRVLGASLIGLAVAGLFCWLALPSEYYNTLVRFSRGANNLPLLPAAHLLFYILTMFLIVPFLLAMGLRKPGGDDVPAAALCGALGLLCIFMAPGAMSRCDPPHVLFYGMGASLLLMVRLANTSRRVFAAYTIAYAIVFIGLMQVVNLRVFYGIPARALLSRQGLGDLVENLRLATDTEHPDAGTLSALDRYRRLGLPFATFGDPAVEKYVASHGLLSPDYYISVIAVYTAEALERKRADVAKAEYLLVPRGFGLRPSEDPCVEYRKSLRQWFLYRPTLPCRAAPLDPVGALNSFIADHYVPIEHIGSWLVLGRASKGSSSTAD